VVFCTVLTADLFQVTLIFYYMYLGIVGFVGLCTKTYSSFARISTCCAADKQSFVESIGNISSVHLLNAYASAEKKMSIIVVVHVR
jgi:hypothetical protein